ncbi:T9SS type A sorting domain-containing protein [Flavobacterium inviolabile]|uniref:T9SS type A sorting domain-containing protein n=1 Tax=Flavobacterium inviolabile TaxID=2748320 RepID=UPI0015B2DC8B|nr:T9SS type A sorting domain-containing protein [Flavobacterium inviolabile]
MKKQLYILVALFMASFVQGQVSITQAEYFWDTDPGYGNGIAIAAADGSFSSAFEKIAASGINLPGVGLHKFNIRFKDNQNLWGSTFTSIVNVEATVTSEPVRIVQAEYFWDTDPGYGNGTPILAADGNFNSAYEKLLANGIPVPNVIGLHVFNIRLKDNQGLWGSTFRNVVSVENTLSVNDPTVSNFYFYPNPATSTVHFNKEITQVTVLDLNGRLIKTSGDSHQLNIADLAAGTYVLKITTPDGHSFTKKMIKS